MLTAKADVIPADNWLKRKGAGAESKQAKRAAKDPNMPKRPPNASYVFTSEFREQYEKDHPNNKSVAVHENVQSEDDDYYCDGANATRDDSGEEDDGRHARMLQGITGMPSEAFEESKKMKMKDAAIPELYPESEYNPSRDVMDGDGCISIIEDLLYPLRKNPTYGKLRKRMQQIEKNSRTIYAPLPKADQAKVERKAAYEISKKDVTKFRETERPRLFILAKV